ncbi:thermoresistant gluconokinase-like [Oppia nitens]|uniref:thermoresistant gluconokinase-like n=1 Tax=Oppia nitens TaxID=1686743 RepID=UPI0023DB3AE4|nr:thermoresistant gluconokinase-like [Oppia nitens]
MTIECIPVYILMGTCGCGKTTYAEALVKEFGCHYIEGDRLHPEANVQKMSAGIPLTDGDRWGWLTEIRDTYVAEARKIQAASGVGRHQLDKSDIIVVTCSALKRCYRDLLRDVPLLLTDSTTISVQFVYLKGTYKLIESRMIERTDHFMATKMLDSQWQTLEVPDPLMEPSIIVQDISADTETVVQSLVQEITKRLLSNTMC